MDAVIANWKAMVEKVYGADNFPVWSELIIKYLAKFPTIIPAEDGE